MHPPLSWLLLDGCSRRYVLVFHAHFDIGGRELFHGASVVVISCWLVPNGASFLLLLLWSDQRILWVPFLCLSTQWGWKYLEYKSDVGQCMFIRLLHGWWNMEQADAGSTEITSALISDKLIESLASHWSQGLQKKAWGNSLCQSWPKLEQVTAVLLVWIFFWGGNHMMTFCNIALVIVLLAVTLLVTEVELFFLLLFIMSLIAVLQLVVLWKLSLSLPDNSMLRCKIALLNKPSQPCRNVPKFYIVRRNKIQHNPMAHALFLVAEHLTALETWFYTKL